jgi:hypothetical protein
MSTSQVLKAIIMSMNDHTDESAAEIVYGMQTSANCEKQSDTELLRWKGRRGSHARESR